MTGFPRGWVGGHIVNAPGGGFLGGNQGSLSPIKPIVFNGTQEAELPDAYVVINGSPFSLVDFTTTYNAHGVLDTLDFTVAMYTNPDWTQFLFRNETDTTPIPVILMVGYPSSITQPATQQSLTQRFVGQIDQYTISHLAGTVKFQCRSMGAILADRRLTTPISYQTSVELIQAQCKAVGLVANIDPSILSTPVQMASVFARIFVAGVKNFRVWDLILQASQYDDADVWVDGNTLYYWHTYNVTRTNVPLIIGTNLEEAESVHAAMYNRKIRVEIRTWDPVKTTGSSTRVQTLANGDVQQAQLTRSRTSTPIWGTTGTTYTSYSYNADTGAYTQTSGSSNKTGGGFSSTTTELADSGIERYIIPVKGLTPQECNDLALKTWRRISMHEYTITLKLAMTSELFSSINRNTLIVLSGSPYQKINGKYWPRRITESSDLTSGAKWLIEAVNHQLPLGQGTE